MTDTPQTTPDIVDRLRRLSSGRTYPATPEMQFHDVVEDAIAEIERLRADAAALRKLVAELQAPPIIGGGIIGGRDIP